MYKDGFFFKTLEPVDLIIIYLLTILLQLVAESQLFVVEIL